MADENTGDSDITQFADPPFRAEEPDLPELDEVTPLPASPRQDIAVADLRDRVSSVIIDGLVFYFLYLAILFLYRMIVWKQPIGPIPAAPPHVYFFHGIFAAVVLLYYFIGEVVFFTTIGKFCGWMSVRSKEGGVPSIFSILIRTILRPVDLVLGILPTWILLEKTEYHQRLGDLAAGTVVVKRFAKGVQHYPVEGLIASASLRVLTGIVDCIFFAGWAGGYFLLIDPQRPLVSTFFLAATPFVLLFWFLAWELMAHTSPGKWMAGLRYTQEDGSSLTFGGALFRTLLRPIDFTPIGWLAFFLSERKQRVGDLIGGSIVIHAKRHWSGIVGLVLSTFAIAALWFVGLSNPRNFTTSFFNLQFLSGVAAVTSEEAAQDKVLMVLQFQFLEPDKKIRPKSQFKAGETVSFSFQLIGFTARDERAWVQEDLSVRYPDGSMGFKQENLIDFRQKLENPYAPLELANTVNLPPNAQVGRYTLILTLHDRLSNRQLMEQRFFEVTAP